MKYLAVFSLLMIAYASSASVPEDDVHTRMQEIRSQLISFLPLVYKRTLDHAAFFEGVRELQSSLSSIGSHFFDEGMPDQLTYETLNRNLEELTRYEDYISLSTAKKMVSQSIELCTSCHKLDQISKPGQRHTDFSRFDEFTLAELSFVTRDYKTAINAYEQYIRQNIESEERRDLALKRLLTIQLEILADVQAVTAQFTQFANHREFTDPQRDSFQNWLEVLQKADAPARFSSVQEMDAYLSKDEAAGHMGSGHKARFVYWLLVRHQLNRFLIDPQFQNELPITIYWHAVSNRVMQFEFYDAASRRYLEQCVRDFPEHPYARRCLDEYETLVLDSFAASDRRELPAGIKQDLRKLEALL